MIRLFGVLGVVDVDDVDDVDDDGLGVVGMALAWFAAVEERFAFCVFLAPVFGFLGGTESTSVMKWPLLS